MAMRLAFPHPFEEFEYRFLLEVRGAYDHVNVTLAIEKCPGFLDGASTGDLVTRLLTRSLELPDVFWTIQKQDPPRLHNRPGVRGRGILDLRVLVHRSSFSAPLTHKVRRGFAVLDKEPATGWVGRTLCCSPGSPE